MSFLATADLQCEWQNLDLCTTSWVECLDICKKYDLEYIVFCGDGKEVYDPVSIRVIKWWQGAIDNAINHGIKVIYLRGNHDRISTFDIGGSWLSILKRAGAITFDKPGIYEAGGGHRFFMLPYAKLKTLREWASHLAKNNPSKNKDVLFFHANLIEGRYSQHGQQALSGLSCDDLFHNRYRYCIGGDIHFPQKMEENVYYTGSSFCHDWGEVNQRKRYLVVRDSDIISVHSQIPRWYDSSVPGFHRATRDRKFDGSRVRVRIHVSPSEDYGRKIDAARREAEGLYRGAEIFVVPEFSTDSKTDQSAFKHSDSDERKLRKYIEQSRAPKGISEKRTVEYMLHKLSKFAGGLRGKSKFKFIRAYGRNFLSFRKLDISFHRGITLVRGENRDRANKSNGSGKTGYMQPIPVSLFGSTFKKQKHDHWSNRWSPKKKALAGVVGIDEKGNTIEIVRGRRPTQLQLLVNGQNHSSGMKSTDRTGTQAQIESITGFTWDTLANAVYMDRTVANTFLAGTNAQRTNILSRFQNLERFEKALRLVKRDNKTNQDKLYENENKLERTVGSIEECEKSLSELKRLQKMQIKGAHKEYQHYKLKLHRFKKKNYKKFKRFKAKEHKLEKLYSEALKHVSEYESKFAVKQEHWNFIKSRAEKWLKLKGKEKCPTCFQSIDIKWLRKYKGKWIEKLREVESSLSRAEDKLKYARKNLQLLDGSHSSTEMELSKIEREERDLEASIKTTYRHYNELRSEQHAAFAVIGKTKDKLKELKHKKHKLQARKEELRLRSMMYAYVLEAFSRDGIPAFLNRQLCPILNHGADYYSELFTDKEIQVRFEVKGGEFVPEVINTKGGENISDQSTGELSIAALIASFAACETAPKTNLLMLDEPAEGLDEQAARQFARGLIKLKSRFRTIFVTTHNRAIESALSAEHKITILKKDGISRVI